MGTVSAKLRQTELALIEYQQLPLKRIRDETSRLPGSQFSQN
jgi:hypothetical protein